MTVYNSTPTVQAQQSTETFDDCFIAVPLAALELSGGIRINITRAITPLRHSTEFPSNNLLRIEIGCHVAILWK